MNARKPDFDMSDLDDGLEGAGDSNAEIRRNAHMVNGGDVVEVKCPKCGGSGQWRGSYTVRPCFGCDGTGTVKPRKAAGMKGRKTAAANFEGWKDENSDLLQRLSGISDWNEFAQKMLDRVYSDGAKLTDNQIAACERMLEKVDATRAAKRKERTESAPTVDLSPIKAMFEQAVKSGLKRTAYRAEGVIINRAPDHGRNAGALYVRDESSHEYLGKVVDNRFLCTREGEGFEKALQVIAANPSEAAVRWGQKTGSCSCCGRELTDPNSIAAGIGPICAAKWGL